MIPDSLKGDSIEQLYNKLFAHANDSVRYSIYGHASIAKFREQKKYEEWGFYDMAKSSPHHWYVHYYDSVVKYANRAANFELISYAYLKYGQYYYGQRNFKNALDYYIKAYNTALNNNDKPRLSSIQISLGLMHERTGNYIESLEYIKASYRYKNSVIEAKPFDSIDKILLEDYLNNINLLSNSYRLNKKNDSAIWAVQEVYRIAPKKGYNEYINKACFDMAEIHYDKMEYQSALDSITIALPSLYKNNDVKNIAYAYYLKGMSHIAQNKNEIGVKELIKMDSIFNITNDLHPNLRSGFEALIDTYKKKNLVNEQLYYVEQLLQFDSIINDNKHYLIEGIVNKIDKPTLIKEQEKLKNELEDSRRQKNIQFLIGIILTVGIILLLIIRIRRYRKKQDQIHLYYQEKFDRLITEHKPIEESALDHTTKVDQIDDVETNENLGIDEHIISALHHRLNSFESKLEFINSEITSSKLAKELGTNTSYLGKVIRIKHNKTFREYINDLRIGYALERLRNDRKFKGFSVIAIAREVGYKNSPPFSRAFKEKTGLNPSEFIQQLKDN